jgi:hypothetical protein
MQLNKEIYWTYPEPDESIQYPPLEFLKFYFNIILPLTPRIPKWSCLLMISFM